MHQVSGKKQEQTTLMEYSLAMYIVFFLFYIKHSHWFAELWSNLWSCEIFNCFRLILIKVWNWSGFQLNSEVKRFSLTKITHSLNNLKFYYILLDRFSSVTFIIICLNFNNLFSVILFTSLASFLCIFKCHLLGSLS